MSTVSIEEAKIRLSELVHGLTAGDEVIIVENDQPVARIVAPASSPRPAQRSLGTMPGSVVYMAPDFDAPWEDFKDYME
jgi:antitoxin (DNA-binding transcriptional repressor) of toxin-antitoxin stability system